MYRHFYEPVGIAMDLTVKHAYVMTDLLLLK